MDNSDTIDLSPQDRDYTIRTILGEAGNQGDDGMAGVANVVLNRLAAGRFGKTATDVVTAPAQFTPWQTRRSELLSYSPNDPTYQRAGQILDAAASGDAPDITNGSTHFYAPALIGKPKWSANETTKIGGHIFSAPEGRVVRNQKPSTDPDIESMAQAWGGAPASDGTSQPATAASPSGGQKNGPAGDPEIDGMVEMWGGGQASQQPGATAAPAGADNPPIDPSQHPLTVRPKTPFGAIDIANTPKPADDYAKGGDESAAVGRGIIEGLPIVGPYALSGVEHAVAAVRALSKDEPFSQALGEVQNFSAKTAENSPNAEKIGGVLGNVAAFGGLGSTAAGAGMLGITGDNLLMRAATGGLTSAAIGGGDAAVRSGGDPAATAIGATVGGLAGASGPLAAEGAQWGVNKLAPYVQGFMPKTAAPNALLEAVHGTGGDLPTMAQRLADNPRLSLMDVNPGARTIAQGLAAQPGKARDALVTAYGQRAGEAQNAVTGAYDAAMGPTPDVLATLNGIKQTAATNAKQGFGQALAGAKPVDLSSTIQSLDGQIAPGVNAVVSTPSNIPLSPIQQRLQQIKGLITDGTSVVTDPVKLHQIQSQLRTEADTLLSSSSGSDRLMGKAVQNARNNIVEAIDEATGGKFKPAQKQYADDMAVQDAFNKGLSIFSNRSGVNGLEDRPEYWRAFVANASPAERQALTLGTRTAADQAMGSVRNAALKGETIPQAGFNLDKLKAVIGDKEAATLAKRMADEQDMAKTNAALFEGSQTQPRQQAKVATAIREIAPLTAEVGLPTFAGLTGHPYTAAGMIGMAAARRGVQLVGRAADRSRNALQAQMLSSSGPAAQDSINKLIALAGQRGLPTFAQGPVGRGANMLLDAAPTTYSQFAEPLPPVRVNRLMKAVGGGGR